MARSPIRRQTGLKRPIEIPKKVATDVRKSADHVGVLGTVLSKELPKAVQVREVAQAIDQTGELEAKLSESAAKLVDVTKALKKEMAMRKVVSSKLKASESKVKKLTGKPRRTT